MNKTLVLGYFGYQTNQLDGQTVKTWNIYKMLEKYGSQYCQLAYYDMQSIQFNKFLVFDLIQKLWHTKTLVYIPADGNLKYIFPFIYIFSKLRGFSILYIVVGGWLSDFVKTHRLHKYMLKHIKHIFPEVKETNNILCKQFNFNNTEVFPNFRINNFMPSFSEKNNELFNVVFMARINKQKGYDSIFKLAETLREKRIENITIDFYGQIYEQDKVIFLTLVDKYKFVHYKGCLKPENIYVTLAQYDVMLLPTKRYTEGFPGTILDSYIAGIPVIVTNWMHAKDYVDDEICGCIIPFDDNGEYLIKKTMDLYNDRDKLARMKQNAWEKSKEYSENKAWEILRPYLIG